MTFQDDINGAIREIEGRGSQDLFLKIIEARSFLAVSFEQYTQNKNQSVQLFTDSYYTYHYFAYVNFFYSLKERTAQFINKYLRLGNPIDDVSYHRISHNEEAQKVFKKIFDFFADPEFKSISSARKTMVHRSQDYISAIQIKDSASAPQQTPQVKLDKDILDKPNEKLSIILIKIVECIIDELKEAQSEKGAIDKGSA
ncbi:MAG: Cthe_2314 family HEPN domain-containing protein [Patescibacteria group bacterium]